MTDKLTIFLELVDKLRDPKEGCPWNIAQTHCSLIDFLIEESEEAVEAVKNKNIENLKEELGDLLLQIALHAKIAEEKNQFTFEDIIDGISHKIIFRHPYVFNDLYKNRRNEYQTLWEEFKSKENKNT